MHHAGLGLRAPHWAAALDQPPPLAFVEVHAENFFADGGAALGVLQAARERWPVSLHGVGLGLASAAGLDAWHLDRLARLVERADPVRVSDHAAFCRVPRRHGAVPLHANDLLPPAFTEASLALLAANVQRVQDRLRRPIGVENLAAALRWADDRIAEPQFFNELARRTGCWLLLDLNNLVVNALNDRADPVRAANAWVDAVDPHAVGEIHLAGHDAGGDFVVDDHGAPVPPAVWQVYAHALRRLGPRPTLIERDTNLPPWAELLAEAGRAEAMAAAHALAEAA